MTEPTTDPKSTNLDIYGNAPIPWTRALAQLDAGGGPGTYWLATTRPDGRPHIASVGARWVDGKVYFTSGAAARKSRNLSANPNCAVSVSLRGLDLVIEGSVARVTNEATWCDSPSSTPLKAGQRQSKTVPSPHHTVPRARDRRRGIST